MLYAHPHLTGSGGSTHYTWSSVFATDNWYCTVC